MKKALIIGIYGQDGYFLSKFLLSKNYRVFGLVRRIKPKQDLSKKIKIFKCHYRNLNLLNSFFKKNKFDEIYNLSAQSYTYKSWNKTIETFDTNYRFFFYLLESVKKFNSKAKILQCLSSEMFGNSNSVYQNEKTPHNPQSPYGLFKSQSYQLSIFYRNFNNLFISNAILFNHESDRRNINYIFQKLSYAVACLSCGIINSKKKNEIGEKIIINGKIKIGDLNIKRDWGSAEEYVTAMWLILKQKKPNDFVVGSGVSKSLKEICNIAFSLKGLNWKKHIISSSGFYRKYEIAKNKADIRKIKKINWFPKKTVSNILLLMIDRQIKLLKKK
jgi:GDPmannose 4,6-dehydratase